EIYQTENPAKIVDYEIIKKDGSIRVLEISVSLMKDPSGRLMGFRGVTRDITERKEVERALEETSARFEALFESANEMIITTDDQGYILRLNKKTEEISGYSRDELIGESILKIAYPKDRGKYLQFWKDMLDGKNPRYELRGISKTGYVGHLLASGSVIKKGEKIVEIQYNAQDITESKQSQATITHLKDRLKNIVESSPNVIISLDKKGNIDMVNPVAERFFNRPAAGLKGKPISYIDPYLKRYESVIEKVQESKLPKFLSEELLSDKSGRLFDVSIYPLTSNGTDGAVFNALDITERKRMELQLIHAQKMETIGELAGGFAHDFNNILTGIIGNLSMLRITNDATKKKQYMDTIENVSNHAKNLVQQLLVLSAKEEGRPKSLPVCTLIEEGLNIALSSIPKNIRISFDNKDEDTNVFIDHAQFVQILLNLIINASDAIGDTQDGRIVIHTHPLHVDKDSKRQYLLPKAGRYIRIDVTDNGCGMDKEILSRIFDPFFTTKGKGTKKGTGLGLSIVYNIVKNAGGNIQISSEKGIGTKFSILLPLSKKTPALTQQDKAKTIKKGHGNILLVDDEDMIREIGKEIIEALGYKVITVKDGYECIDILKRDSDKFDLVILDMIMPGLDGKHTLDKMKRLNINTRVIISSGFAFDYEASDNIFSDSLVVGRLNKPFNMNDLSHILSEILS
ncbi:MAG: PAS domain S-box protein, partial [Thermodesulfobacteriota bacterium]|nr:PAS domain S-box protein [Thermodesulfobacteriota bacterium]